jgi:septum site-determining protein MinC
MAADSPGRARACFDLKRTTYPLISLVLRTTDLADILDELQSRLGDSPDFFDQDLLVVNLTAVSRDESDLDFAALVALLRQYGVQPIGVHGGSPAQMSAAAEAGLVPTPDVSAASSMARTARPEPAREPASAAAPASARPRAPASADSGPVPANTLLIDKPLRSGQRVYAKGADVVLLAAVNFGAEVFADGNIHVYAPLRGRAIAGARGNAAARIFTTCLDPLLIAIAGVYRTTEVPLPEEVAGKPAQIRLVGESLVIEPL